MRTLIALLLLGSVARAQPTTMDEKKAEARRLYGEAQSAFSAGDYQTAYERFNECFHLTFGAELLFDMSASLEKLERFHDAADDLRSYLRRRPADPDRAAIQKRIDALEERQLAKHRPPPLIAPPVKDDRYGAAAVGVAISAIAVVAIGGGLYSSVVSDYPDLENACRMRKCGPADWRDLEMRANASYGMFALAGALAVVDVALWITDAKKRWRR